MFKIIDNKNKKLCCAYRCGNAKRRGKDFRLTLAEFELFCEQTNYLVLKGKTAKSASIDRIDHTRGYFIDNIQVLSLSDNSKKQHTDKSVNQDDDCPF